VAGGLYAVTLFLGVNNASTVQPVVAVERGVSYRERAAGTYSAIPYAIAQVRDPKKSASALACGFNAIQILPCSALSRTL
jgi:hypothetical protein